MLLNKSTKVITINMCMNNTISKYREVYVDVAATALTGDRYRCPQMLQSPASKAYLRTDEHDTFATNARLQLCLHGLLPALPVYRCY